MKIEFTESELLVINHLVKSQGIRDFRDWIELPAEEMEETSNSSARTLQVIHDKISKVSPDIKREDLLETARWMKTKF